ncbi:MAG: hypothetical protein J6M93_07340 [Succinivibrio sp.]|nr:hypothetical protein [Succinivibrio sp.]
MEKEKIKENHQALLTAAVALNDLIDKAVTAFSISRLPSLIFILIVAGCFPLYGCSSPNTSPSVRNIQMVNPFIKADSLQQAEEGANFTLSCPDRLREYHQVRISYIKDRLIEVVYSDGSRSLQVRKAATQTEDISGDYNRYSKTSSVLIQDTLVTLKGNDLGISTAIWAKECFSYAFTASSPVSQEFAAQLISNIH